MYTVKEHLKPTNLNGISQKQIDDHWKLYEGYVNQVNNLTDRYRFSFEYNGMVLHEYYFENLNATPLPQGLLQDLITKTWGSVKKWEDDFISTGKTRGIGWAILYVDPNTKTLLNLFTPSHDIGHIAGFKPLLVMDCWEHAYMIDHHSGGRADYINAFIQNINWHVVVKRLNTA